MLARGSECDPANFNGYCEAGSVCLNCNPEGRGYRCVDQNSPCCNSGGFDEDWGGNTYISEGGFSWTNSCCNYKCFDPDDVNHCGDCQTDCVNTGNVCVVPGTERCEWSGEDFVCGGTEDETKCPDSGTGVVSQCISDGSGVFHCFNYTPFNDPLWIDACQDSGSVHGIECSSDAQREDCTGNCTYESSSCGDFNLWNSSRCECH